MNRSCIALVSTSLFTLFGCGDDGGGSASRTAVDDAIASQLDVELEYCECTSEPAACRDSVRDDFSDVQDGCFASTYGPYAARLDAYFECGAAAQREQLTCVSAASCDGTTLDACGETADAAIEDCPDDAGALDEWLTAVETCRSERVTGPPGGACPNETVSGTGQVLSTTTIGKGADIDPSCGQLGSADITVEWTAPSAGTFLVSLAGSDFDTVLAVYDGCGGAELDCNDDDDDSGEFFSALVLEATAGERFIFVIAGFGPSDAGVAVLSVEPQTP